MAKFFLGIAQETPVTVSKNPSQWMVDFELPNSVRDNLPKAEVEKLEGIFLMSFYEPPMVGDSVEYLGFLWRVALRYHYAHRHRKHEPRQISRLGVEFIGEVPGGDP
jgi:hypothetical protein